MEISEASDGEQGNPIDCISLLKCCNLQMNHVSMHGQRADPNSKSVRSEQENEAELCNYLVEEGGIRQEYEEMMIQFGCSPSMRTHLCIYRLSPFLYRVLC